MGSLASLSIGARARVTHIAGDDEVSARMCEMGITPGVSMEMVGRAPLGDPLEFEVRGYRLSLRRSEAERVEVEPVN